MRSATQERLVHGFALAAGFYALAVLCWIATGIAIHGVAAGGVVLYAISTLGAAAAIPTIFLVAADPAASPSAVGLSHPFLRPLAVGAATGAAGLAILVATLSATGFLAFQPAAGQFAAEDVWLLLVLTAGVAAEELLFRGYGFQRLIYAAGPWPPILVAGCLFGLLHASNPGSTRLSVVNTGLFGALFGYALVRTRSWWFPFGMHLGWNLALAATGSPLSGIRIKALGWRMDPAGPELWSGGPYGPEASLMATAVGFLLWFAIWRLPICFSQADRLWDGPDRDEQEAGT